MKSRSTHMISIARIAMSTAILTVALLSGIQAASAGMLSPVRDTSGSGDTATEDYPVLIGSGYEGQIAVDALSPVGDTCVLSNVAVVMYPVLIGSGYEGQVTADGLSPVRVTAASGDTATVDNPVLIGSGYEGQVAVAERDQASTSGTLYESILDGSGYELKPAGDPLAKR